MNSLELSDRLDLGPAIFAMRMLVAVAVLSMAGCSHMRSVPNDQEIALCREGLSEMERFFPQYFGALKGETEITVGEFLALEVGVRTAIPKFESCNDFVINYLDSRRIGDINRQAEKYLAWKREWFMPRQEVAGGAYSVARSVWSTAHEITHPSEPR